MNLSPTSLFHAVAAAWRLALGRGQAETLFTIDRASLWQSVWGAWILHVLATSFATSIFGAGLFLRLSLVSLISSLAYILLVHFLLGRIGKSERFLAFIIPYQWLMALQAILFGAIAMGVLVVPALQLQLAVIPVVVWMIYLNTVTDDGGTRFPQYDLTTDAVAGRVVLWPTSWTHFHHGVVSKTQKKYIATGWYSFVS